MRAGGWEQFSASVASKYNGEAWGSLVTLLDLVTKLPAAQFARFLFLEAFNLRV